MNMFLKMTEIVILACLRPYISPFLVHFRAVKDRKFWEWVT